MTNHRLINESLIDPIPIPHKNQPLSLINSTQHAALIVRSSYVYCSRYPAGMSFSIEDDDKHLVVFFNAYRKARGAIEEKYTRARGLLNYTSHVRDRI